jgi:hypothetical protein
MGKIVTKTINLSTDLNPDAGFITIALDTDGKLKKKDSAGVITEIGASTALLISDTYDNWKIARNNSTLVPGIKAYINDRDIILDVIGVNKFSLDGKYLSRNPLYVPVVGTPGTSILGQWYVGIKSYFLAANTYTLTTGDIVTYDGYHYQSITGQEGTAPSSDTVNWLLIGSRGSGNEIIDRTTRISASYVVEVYNCNYSIDDDYISKISDCSRGNEFEGPTFLDAGGTFPVFSFQWGNPHIYKNKINGGIFDCLNYNFKQSISRSNSINGNNIISSSVYLSTASCNFFGNHAEGKQNTNVYLSNATGQISNNRIYIGCNFTANHTDPNAYIDSNIVEAGSSFYVDNLIGFVTRCRLNNNSSIDFSGSIGGMDNVIVDQGSSVNGPNNRSGLYNISCINNSQIYAGNSASSITSVSLNDNSSLNVQNTTNCNISDCILNLASHINLSTFTGSLSKLNLISSNIYGSGSGNFSNIDMILGGSISCYGFTGTVTNCMLKYSGSLDIGTYTGYFNNNEISYGGYVTLSGSRLNIGYCKISKNALLYSNNSLATASITNCEINDSSRLDANSITTSLSTIYLNNSSLLSVNSISQNVLNINMFKSTLYSDASSAPLTNMTINFCTVYRDAVALSNCIFNNGQINFTGFTGAIDSLVIDTPNGAFNPLPRNLTNHEFDYKILNSSMSTLSITLDITGRNTLPGISSCYGIVILTSTNATETLNNDSGQAPPFPVKFKPAANLTALNFDHYGFINKGGGNPRLTLNGANEDYAIYYRDPTRGLSVELEHGNY